MVRVVKGLLEKEDLQARNRKKKKKQLFLEEYTQLEKD